MRQQGDILIFDYPGGQITFHKDLKKYYDTRVWMWQERDDEKGLIDKAKPATEIQDKISLCLLDFVQKKIIASLANCGLYDLTTEDFLVENPGYHVLVEASQREEQYERKLIEVMGNSAAKDLDQAAAIASQSITGMGFGVLSNDFLAHALYAAQSQSVLNKQTQVAQAKFQSMSSTIQANMWDSISKGIAERREKTYVPECQAAVGQIFEYLLSKYCDCLSQAGQFDKTCLNGIDEARSNSVLGNLDVVEDKERVLYSAIQLCPYNLAIYKAIESNELAFQNVQKEILSTFDLTDMLCDWMVQQVRFHTDNTMEYNLSTLRVLTAKLTYFGEEEKALPIQRKFCSGLIKAYWPNYKKGIEKNRDRIQEILSIVRPLGCSEKTIHSFLLEQAKEELSVYVQIGEHDDIVPLLKTTFPQFCDVGLEDFPKTLVPVLQKAHLPDRALQIYRDLGVNIFEVLSSILWTRVSSFEEADSAIIDLLKEEVEKLSAAQKRELARKLKEREQMQTDIRKEFLLFAILITLAAAIFGLTLCSIVPQLLGCVVTAILFLIAISFKQNAGESESQLAKLDGEIFQLKKDIGKA